MVDFRIRVVVDPKNAEANTKKVDRALDRTATKADNLRATMARMFALVGGAAALTGGIRLLADYGQAMSTVQAVAQATTEQFKELSETAQQLGISTRFSAAQAAEGMVFLARSGLQVEEVLGTIESTLRLAQAGALDLGTASKITAEVMRGFRLEAKDAERIVDVFALTANSANTDVTQLGQGMKFVASIATGLGVSLETTTAAMAALSDAGLQSTMAGTGLRKILSRLESPNAKLREALRRSGQTVDDVRVSSVGLIAALKALRKAGVETGEGIEIFGDRGGPAFEILSNSIPKIEAMDLKLQDAEGTAKRVAEVMDQNLKGALLSLRSAYEGLVLKIGDAGEESSALTGIVRGLTKVLRTLADNADIVAGVLKAVIILLGAKGALGAVRALTAAIAANPIGLLLTALSFGIALLISFKDQISASTDGIASLGDVFAEAWLIIQEVIAGLKDVFIPTLEALGLAAGDAFGGIEISFQGLLTLLAKGSDSIVGLFRGAFEAVMAIWDTLPTRFDDLVNLSLFSIRELAETTVDLVAAAFQTLGDVLRGIGNNIKNAIAAAAGALGALSAGNLEAAQAMADSAKTAVNLMAGEFKTIPGRFKNNLDKLKDASLFPEVELTEGAANLGEIVGTAFTEGFAETTGAEDLVNRLFDGAERRAAERAAAEAGKGAGEGGPAGGPGGTGGPAAPGGLENLDQTTTDFEKLLVQLSLENELLEQLVTTRGAAGEALKAESEAGMVFTEAERQLVEAAKEENALLKEKNRLVNELLGPQEQLNVTIEALNQLLLDNVINQEQYNQKLREAKIAADQASNSIGAGFSRGLERVKEEIEDVGGLVENALVNAFHSAEDALVQFVRTGEFNFKEFANALLDDITRIIIRLLILQAIQAITGTGPTGGGGGGGGGGAPSTKQHGGPVDANRPFLVGEKGPELFVPQGMGNIIPADETSQRLAEGGGGGTTVVQAPAPEVNVSVVNVSDPSEVPDAMDSPAGDQTILNSVTRNKDQIKRLLQ